MKTILIALCCLTLAAIVSNCTSPSKGSSSWNRAYSKKSLEANQVVNYFIMAPPWSGLHLKQVKARVFVWANSHPEWFGENKLQVTSKGFYYPKSGGNGFTAKLSSLQARSLAQTTQFFVTPSCDYTVCDGPGTRGVKTTWAVNTMVPAPISLTAHRTPVLYVVDTGVQPFAMNSDGSLYAWHPEFGPRVKFNQGRTSSLLGDWPPQEDSGHPQPPWDNTSPGDVFASNPPAPWINPGNNSCLNPHADPANHGTKVASTAVGSNVGVLGAIEGITVNVESVRVYPDPIPGYPIRTTTEIFVDGLYAAIEAHLARDGSGAAPSVLLVASRTLTTLPSNARFDDSFEAVVWWAWKKGMFCVAAGGNETTAYGSNPTRRAPHAQWYQPDGSLPGPHPTSPSRFNWVQATSSSGAGWPEFPAPGGGYIPYPDQAYAVLVGGSKTTQTAPTNWAWATGSSIGPGIDIITPYSVPCAKTLKATYDTSNDCLQLSSGTSTASGYVAGAALAYIASRPNSPSPSTVRDWLLSNPGTTSAPTKVSAARVFGSNPALYLPRLYLTPSAF